MKTTAVTKGKPKGAKTLFKNLGRDAALLDVTPDHLRLVASGERISPQLLNRYLTLLEQTNPKLKEQIMSRFHPSGTAPGKPAVPARDPADDMLSWFYIKTVLSPLGFLVCAVEVDFVANILESAGLGFEQVIGAELQAANLGHFDSLKRNHRENKFLLFYLLHRRQLDAAKQFLIRALDARSLLPHCKLSIALPATESWEVIHLPAAPEKDASAK